MKNTVSLATSLVMSLLAISSTIGTTAINADDNFHYDYATVLSSKPVHRIVEVTREERQCYSEEVTYQQPRRNNSGGSLVGGLLGAAIGHAIGHKINHKTGATVLGAVVGSSIANSNQKTSVERTGTRNRCTMVPTSWEEERLIGYNVVYQYNDRTYETRLQEEPGDSLKIRVVVTPMLDSNHN